MFILISIVNSKLITIHYNTRVHAHTYTHTQTHTHIYMCVYYIFTLL